ncbi:MAG: hypothetical protein AAFQ68_20630, partial [Bacteroidota bacterium]
MIQSLPLVSPPYLQGFNRICLFFIVFLLCGFSISHAANPDGDLEIQLLNGSNLVVDPSSEGPELVYLGATITNRGDNDLENLFVNIGDFSQKLAGTYPARTHSGLVGSFSLQHIDAGTEANDASRYINRLAAGESLTLYWLVAYPRQDDQGKWVSQEEGIDDDLWLSYDVWAQADDAGTLLEANTEQQLYFRETPRQSASRSLAAQDASIPAQYQDMLASVESWDDQQSSTVYPGQTVRVAVWHQLSQVSAGYDSDANYSPDFNSALQPVGSLQGFDPACFRLINTSGILIIRDEDGNHSFESFRNQNHFQDIDWRNESVMALVNYDFIAIGAECQAQLNPYQIVAKGLEQEAYNQNYGNFVGAINSMPQPFALELVATDSVVAGGQVSLSYQLSSSQGQTFGEAASGAGLYLQAAIPERSSLISGSASGGSVVLYSIDEGQSWTTEEPADLTSITHLKWAWETDFVGSETRTIGFQLQVENSFDAQMITASAQLLIEGGASLLQHEKAIPAAGDKSLSGKIFADTGAEGNFANASFDQDENGLAGLVYRLYLDADADGELDSFEPLLRQGTTTIDGSFSQTNLPAADILLLVAEDSEWASKLWRNAAGHLVSSFSLVNTNLSNQNIGLLPLLRLEQSLDNNQIVIEGDELNLQIHLEHQIENSELGLRHYSLRQEYDPQQMIFVSAHPAPTQISLSNEKGTLQWQYGSGLRAGQDQTIEVVYRSLEGNSTQDYLTTLVSAAENVQLSDQSQFAGLNDTLSLVIRPGGSIRGYIWNDASGSTPGWDGIIGYEGQDGFVQGVKILAYGCVNSFGERLTVANKPKKSCEQSGNDGQWVVLDSTFTEADGTYRFNGLQTGFYYLQVATESLAS